MLMLSILNIRRLVRKRNILTVTTSRHSNVDCLLGDYFNTTSITCAATSCLQLHSNLLITWYPNFVFIIGETCPFWSAKAAFSNSLTIFPLEKTPRSPPRFPDGQSDDPLAMFANFSPCLRRSSTAFASCSVLTRMCAQCTLSGIKFWYLFLFIMFPLPSGRDRVVGSLHAVANTVLMVSISLLCTTAKFLFNLTIQSYGGSYWEECWM